MKLTAEEETTAFRVMEGLTLVGAMNTEDRDVIANMRASIRRGHPQVARTALKPERIALVGSGPSLGETEGELIALLRTGAKLVTVNGSYQWALERNLIPSAQIVLDARESTARFLEPALPNCRYYAASQCHPAVWDVLQDRPHVGIFHAVADEGDGALKVMLDAYYASAWQGVPGGTTVITRAIGLLRVLGYLRFDLFGVDSCWMDGRHHAFEQAENARDQQYTVTVAPSDDPTAARTFACAPWHLKQFEDLLLMMKLMGEHFLLNVHGDGLVAYAIRTSGSISVEDERTHA